MRVDRRLGGEERRGVASRTDAETEGAPKAGGAGGDGSGGYSKGSPVSSLMPYGWFVEWSKYEVRGGSSVSTGMVR